MSSCTNSLINVHKGINSNDEGVNFSDNEETKTVESTKETQRDDSPTHKKSHSSNDFVSKSNKDFDMRKMYEETMLKILNAHSTEKLTNPVASDTFSLKFAKSIEN